MAWGFILGVPGFVLEEVADINKIVALPCDVILWFAGHRL